MKHFIITYDIKDDKRRSAIYKTLRNYAIPVQLSVFEACLKEENYIMLRYKLERLMRKNEDSIIFYRQCSRCEEDIIRLGASPEPFSDGIYIV
ncbi:CRISPR-associated protein Cas2 [Desulfofarcimen acetoxidans DSM 771]|uniref:CRISPR-associated endoribonuclease Cas2 n=1 Tax=Desulfofarcimen acetoxidans (strain ATCC 49208 / DSM 771 / KCTC 5769 / VKM B-1644 / 5575) TaxID=485916 RepID=C8W2P3_DESAS|nr:CRISPR-associated endonuclease Cas2 [Desulfofarcimen acetoxidans]ACV63727.1 CRISPR-associated protein Cas2 [Desulfofarcimen acetoxidans DSM 771]